MSGKIKELLLSRKFWAALITVVAIVCNKLFSIDIPENTVLLVVTTIASWIIGQAIVDGAKAKNGSSSP